ncbi:MAG: DUF502 domain-containing protein [Verrucomicrobia bacterium]|nr:DUF502 domain-containing protein [Verrucomicrobiota bacterium]
MRKNFATGLIVLLPLLITYTIIAFFLKAITSPFEKIIQALISHIPFLTGLVQERIAYFLSSLCIILGVLAAIILVGMVARLVIFRWLHSSSDALLRKIPVVGKIYKVCKDVTEAFLSERAEAPKQAVLVPYPTEDQLTIGFVTGEFENTTHPGQGETLVSVLIPCTPNPTVGFLCTFPKKSVTLLNLSIDDTLKYLISCGSSIPEIKSMQFK